MGHEESLHQIYVVCHCRRDTRSCRFVWKVRHGMRRARAGRTSSVTTSPMGFALLR